MGLQAMVLTPPGRRVVALMQADWAVEALTPLG
jgi:hypothetical protein